MNFQRAAITTLLILVIGVSVGASTRLFDVKPQQQVVADNAARVVLKAPAKAKIGQLVVLDVSESAATSFKWEVRDKTSNFLVIEGGKRAVFSAEAVGEYTFVVAAAKDDSVDVVIHTVTVTSNTPDADDLPGKVVDWCDAVESPNKRDDALRLSQSFSSLSAIMATEMTAEEIIAATKKSTRDALGDNLKHWTPFLDGLGAEMTRLAAAGQLTDADSHKRVWKTIADALSEYAQSL